MATNQKDLHEETDGKKKKIRSFMNFSHKTLVLAEKKALDEIQLLGGRKFFGLDELKSLNSYRVFVV